MSRTKLFRHIYANVCTEKKLADASPPGNPDGFYLGVLDHGIVRATPDDLTTNGNLTGYTFMK